MVMITLYARQQKRHRYIEQYFGLCGRGRGWDDLGEWHLTCIITYVKRIASPGSMHDTGCSGLVHWDDLEGWYGEEGGNSKVPGFWRGLCRPPASSVLGKWFRLRVSQTDWEWVASRPPTTSLLWPPEWRLSRSQAEESKMDERCSFQSKFMTFFKIYF